MTTQTTKATADHRRTAAALRDAPQPARGAELAAQAAAIPAVDPRAGDRHRDPLPVRASAPTTHS